MNIITEKPLHTFTEEAIRNYIKETVEERAIPDFKDGLKPVQRRILWAMYKLGNTHTYSYKKSARTVGEVIGKYSPHGDAGTYLAMVNMAQARKKYNFVDGQGNWGSYSGDPAAANRYTEAKLSELSDVCLLDKDYLKVVPLVDNFDGTEKEPVYLPSRLPFVLMGNIQGIATAVRTGLPCFTLASLVEACSYYLKNKTLPINALKLEFEGVYGGKCISTEEEIQKYLETGSGSLTFMPDYSIFNDRIEITGIQDGFDFEKIITTLENLSEVKAVKDEGSKNIKVGIYFSSKKPTKQDIEKILSVLKTKTLYSTNILNRQLAEDGSILANYKETNVIKIIQNWCKYRIKLERDYLTNLIGEKEKVIEYQNLLLKASQNVKIIFKALQESDPKKYLQENLKIEENQVDIILDLPIKRLSKLSEQDTKKTLDNLNRSLEELRNKRNNVIQVVIDDLSCLKRKFADEK